MSDATLNGIPVMRGDIVEPFQGAFTVEVELLSEGIDEPLSGAVLLTLMGEEFHGTVVADPQDPEKRLSGDSGGFVRVRAVGGAGGLLNPIGPKEWSQGVTVQQVLTDLLTQGGETQSTDISPDILSLSLTQWSYRTGTVGEALSALCSFLNITWRIRRDGLVWLGFANPQPAPAPDYILIDASPEAGMVGWSLNEVNSVHVDDIIDGLTIRQLTWAFDENSLRVVVTYALGPSAALFDLFSLWLRRLGFDYLRAPPGRIASQNGDGTVQFQPDDSRLPPLKRVAIRLGLPDSSVQINPSSRAVSCWEGGTPAAPVLQSFGSSTASKVRVGVSASPPPQPTILGTSFRSAQSTLDNTATTTLTTAATAATAAGTAFTGLAALGGPQAPFYTTLAAQMGAIAAALGSLSTGFSAFESAAGASNNFLTTIFEAG